MLQMCYKKYCFNTIPEIQSKIPVELKMRHAPKITI